MKISALCIFFSLALVTFAAEAQRKIAFERGNNIWVANLDGTAAKKIAAGSLPNISAWSRTPYCHR
jgi:TolB protein